MIAESDGVGAAAAPGPSLRLRAEAVWHTNTADRALSSGDLAPEATRALLHELQVHQIELEMQNEELRRIQIEAESARADYFDLFDLAPVGFVTLCPRGLVLKVNLAGAALVGLNRSVVMGQPFGRFVAHDDCDRFYLARQQPADVRRSEQAEWRLIKPDGGEVWVQVTTTPALDAQGVPYDLLALSDISERKRSEAALRASEARFRSVVESDMIGMFFWDSSGHITQANRTFLGMMGYSRAELEGGVMSWRDMTPPEFKAADDVALAEILQTGTCQPFEKVYLRKDGTRLPILIGAALIAGAPGEGVAFVLDLTQRQLAEAALVDSEARYRRIVETAEEGIWEIDAQARTTFVNAKMAAMLGYAPADMQGRELTDFMDAEGRRIVAQNLERRQKGVTEQHDFKFRRQDGGSLWTLISTNPIRDAQGGYIGALAMVTDITERRRNEDRMRQLALAVEQSPESIVITDVAGRIEYVNVACLKATGHALNELLGQNPRVLSAGKTPPAVYEHMWQTLRGGTPWLGELLNRRKDGSEHLVSISVTPLVEASGRTSHYVGIQTDITEKRKVEAELHSYRQGLESKVAQRTEELVAARMQADAANQAKSVFLSSMSHEIRTPMSAIIGMTDLLRRGQPTAEQADRLDKIDAAGQHLLAIVNDLLDLAKIEAGRVELEHIDFAPGSVLGQVASITEEAAWRKGLQLVIEGADAVPWVRGDPLRLRQALLNYASNAVKFTTQGCVTLRAELVAESGDKVNMRFSVEDTGPGIAADRLGRLFQDFEQAGAHVMRTHGGTGLGLAITRRLARLMGGDAGVHSTPGEGSRFWFTAHLLKGQAAAAPAAAQDTDAAQALVRQAHGGARILVVEDNEVNRELALAWLGELGMTADTAVDGQDAVEHAKRSAYDLVLMDMQMPVMDGLQATRAIRALPGWQDTPILALTANAFDDSRRACEAAGMNDVIGKPVDLRLLHAALSKWLKVPR